MSAVKLEAVEPGQWAIIRGRSRFHAPAWENGRAEIDDFGAGPVEKLTAQYVFTQHDVHYSKRHDRGEVVAVVADKETARALLTTVRERQLQRERDQRPHLDAAQAIHATASVDIDDMFTKANL